SARRGGSSTGEPVVLAPLLAEHAADLADRAARTKRVPHRRKQVAVAARRLAHAVEARLRLAGVALGAHAGGARELAPLALRVERVQLDRRVLGDRVAVDADDRPLAALDLLLPAERRLFDLRLHPPRLDGGDRAALSIHLLDQLERAPLELVGERLDVVRPAERVGRGGRPGLRLEDLLGAERDRRGVLGRERERLVER